MKTNKGDKIGVWFVTEQPFKKNKWGSYLVEAQCAVCGAVVEKVADALRQSGCRECYLEERKQNYAGLSVNLFNRIKDNAVKREFEFNITIEQVWSLFEKQKGLCALSGVEIFFDHTSSLHSERRKKTTASLDRKDSSIGYVLDNIQWVHKKVNVMKMDMNQDSFIDFCEAIAMRQKAEPRTRLVARVNIEGIHRWRDCPLEEVFFLRDYHRHVFHIHAKCFVNHQNRDIEFIQLTHQIKQYLRGRYYSEQYKCLFFKDMSCEMIAQELVERFGLYECEVNEDGESGAIVKNI